MTPGPSYYDHWRELSAETWGEPASVAFGIEEGVEALEDYANEGPFGLEAIDALEAAEEFFRAASIEIGEVE